MRIYKRIEESEYGFQALARSENCGHEQFVDGYDDDIFFSDVLPEIECTNCRKSRRDYEREESKNRILCYV